MAIKQTLTLSLFSFLALILAINGADMAAPPPSVDCSSVIVNMADCLTFVESGSTVAKPEKTCCAGLKTVLQQNPVCLCETFKNSASLGVTLDVKKALTLPDACHIKAPPFSECNLTLPGVTPPTLSPPVTSSPGTLSPPAPSSPATLPGASIPAASSPDPYDDYADYNDTAAMIPSSSLGDTLVPTGDGEPLILPNSSINSSSTVSVPTKSMATQITINPFKIVVIFTSSFMMVYRNAN